MSLSLNDLGCEWKGLGNVEEAVYICGFCGNQVASDKGYEGRTTSIYGVVFSYVRICPGCKGPTLFTHTGKAFPECPPGMPVANVPDDLRRLYDEARWSVTVGAYTGAVMLCRKMLMNIAVSLGAATGLPYLGYVDYLENENYIPRNGRVWVDYIRTKGNEANHEIPHMSRQDAIAIITFVEALLRNIYELPSLVPSAGTGP